MIKLTFICSNCKKETIPEMDNGEDFTGTATIDFDRMVIQFICPKCYHVNLLNLGDIQKALNQKTKLPRIGGTRY